MPPLVQSHQPAPAQLTSHATPLVLQTTVQLKPDGMLGGFLRVRATKGIPKFRKWNLR